jgi:uncharacterized membrane protein YfcA
MGELWSFVLLFVPIAVLVGIAAASISFSAWNIVVPLLFVGFNFTVYDAITFSVVMDFTNALILTVVYSRNRMVDFRDGMWVIPALVGAGIAFYFSSRYLAQNPEKLKGGIGYLVLLIGIYFIIKAVRDNKAGSNESDPVAGNPGSKVVEFLRRIGKPVMVGATILYGGLGGLVGIGNGTDFVVTLLVFLPGYTLLKATGTGAFMMLVLMGLCAVLFGTHSNPQFLWRYLLLAIPFSSAGVIVASRYTLRLSKAKLYLMVGIAVFTAGLVSSVQSLIL